MFSEMGLVRYCARAGAHTVRYCARTHAHIHTCARAPLGPWLVLHTADCVIDMTVQMVADPLEHLTARAGLLGAPRRGGGRRAGGPPSQTPALTRLPTHTRGQGAGPGLLVTSTSTHL